MRSREPCHLEQRLPAQRAACRGLRTASSAAAERINLPRGGTRLPRGLIAVTAGLLCPCCSGWGMSPAPPAPELLHSAPGGGSGRWCCGFGSCCAQGALQGRGGSAGAGARAFAAGGPRRDTPAPRTSAGVQSSGVRVPAVPRPGRTNPSAAGVQSEPCGCTGGCGGTCRSWQSPARPHHRASCCARAVETSRKTTNIRMPLKASCVLGGQIEGKGLNLYDLFQHRASVDEERMGRRCICLVSFQKSDIIFSYASTLVW